LLAGFALLAAAIVVGCHPSSHNDARRNVLLLTIDSLRADHLGCYGYGPPTSPRIDAFAAQAALFRHAYATTPWTLPSHVSILTGLNADVHGVDTDKAILSDKAVTLAEALHQHGYWTGAVVCAPLLRRRYGLDQGFDVYDIGLMGANYRRARLVKVAAGVTDKALHYIDDHEAQPFFLWLHYWDPHYDYNPAQQYVDLFDPDYHGRIDGLDIQNRTDIAPGMDERDLRHLIALYDGEIRYTDDAVGALLDGLHKRGLMQNTMIVLVADHGEEFLDHGGTGHTWTCYEELMRVPLVIRVPWIKPAAQAFDQQVSQIDILPTVLAALSIDYDKSSVQGRSLMELIAHGAPLGGRALLMETRAGRLQPRGKIGRWTAVLTSRGIKYHRYLRDEAVEMMFDLAGDPREQSDLSGRRPDEASELSRQLQLLRGRDERLRERLRIGREEKLNTEQVEMLRGLGYIQ
jgi:arylsulfatase A-like enzyme